MDADGRVGVRLSAMMALVYSVQGAFWPLLSIHLRDLGVTERGRGWIFATAAMASVAVPLGAGRLVDRLLPTQKLLAITFALGSLVLAAMAWGVAAHAPGWFAMFLLFWMIQAPNYSLANALAFRNLAHPRRDFGRVRLWGTVGWMAVGWSVSVVLGWSGAGQPGRGMPEAFWIASGLAAVTALYCLTLPNTPPLAVGGPERSGLSEIAGLARGPGMGAYLVLVFGIGLTTPFVYQVMPSHLRAIGMNRAWVPSAMSLGQFPEILALAALPWLIRRGGFRLTLGLGIAAYVVRFGSLAFDPPLWLATLGIPLHGVAVACFNIGGQVFVDGNAPADRRAGAQALNTVIGGGLGTLCGSMLAGEVVRAFPGRFGPVFLVPCLIDAALLGVLWFGFRPRREAGDASPSPLPAPFPPPRVAVVTET